jgi:hypothetical protein
MIGHKTWKEILIVAVGLILFTGMTHATFGAEQEVLKYRLVKAKTLHLNDETAAKSYAKSLRSLGCETKLANHGGHFDLSIPSMSWREASFADHAAVTKWEKWLKSLGFETQHHH